ncbi:galactose mutarotase [Flavobacterium sp. F-328]|uniref:Aldose 1-epimerase n=1 Tax=Flavobacterium erciyesense TaxID=2825842 RepID=A0ABS5D5D9_9FLAO|nr:aldose epimerase family protein [Flavobacterium erciyesense]MBQ0909249.1 galactose mutarotase [Flavobacterium erciyesense]
MKIKHKSHFNSNSAVKSFGILADGSAVFECELKNGNGLVAKIITYGATLTSLKVPLKDEGIVDVVLGFETLEQYLQSFDLPSAPYFGATVGRFAGRINKGSFPLDGATINLDTNSNGNTLHGGSNSFSQKNWVIKKRTEGKNPSVTLSHTSPDGDNGFPGELQIDLTYTLTETNELALEYIAHTTAKTIVNLTHHSYFNLDGQAATVVNHELKIKSQRILDTISSGIPTGKFLNVANCPFDFSEGRLCPSKIDNTFVLNQVKEYAASLYNSTKTLKMSVFTNQPAVHVYVGGNCFSQLKGKEGADYTALSGVCFETQNFPDAPNHSHFPSCELDKGELYYHKIIYKFKAL